MATCNPHKLCQLEKQRHLISLRLSLAAASVVAAANCMLLRQALATTGAPGTDEDASGRRDRRAEDDPYGGAEALHSRPILSLMLRLISISGNTRSIYVRGFAKFGELANIYGIQTHRSTARVCILAKFLPFHESHWRRDVFKEKHFLGVENHMLVC